MGYKKAGAGVMKDGEYIAPNGRGWAEYQQFVSQGGSADPEYTIDELLDNKIRMIFDELSKRINLIGFTDQKKKNRSLARGLRLLNKKIDNQLAGQEPDELIDISNKADSVEALSIFADDEENRIKGLTYEELEEYDPSLVAWPS